MLIATIYIGDTHLSVIAVQSLDPHDAAQFSYELHFRDGPSGKFATVVADGENTALYMFAAWIAADEPSLGALDPYLAQLHAKLTTAEAKLFLP